MNREAIAKKRRSSLLRQFKNVRTPGPDKMTEFQSRRQAAEIRSRFYERRESREFISCKMGLDLQYVRDVIMFRHFPCAEVTRASPTDKQR